MTYIKLPTAEAYEILLISFFSLSVEGLCLLLNLKWLDKEELTSFAYSYWNAQAPSPHIAFMTYTTSWTLYLELFEFQEVSLPAPNPSWQRICSTISSTCQFSKHSSFQAHVHFMSISHFHFAPFQHNSFFRLIVALLWNHFVFWCPHLSHCSLDLCFQYIVTIKFKFLV